MKHRSSVNGAEALFVAAFTYALTGILVREVNPMWSDSGQVAARFVLVLAFLFGYRLIKREKWVMTGRSGCRSPKNLLQYASNELLPRPDSPVTMSGPRSDRAWSVNCRSNSTRAI